jgi:hypothetical protein
LLPLDSPAPLHPVGPAAPAANPFGTPQSPSPFTPLTPLPPSGGPTPANAPFGSPYGAAPAKPAWNPPAPEPPSSNHAAIVIGVIAFCGLAVLFCGGLGFLFFMNAKERVVAAAKRAEEQNAVRQLELQREMEQEQRRQRELSQRRANAQRSQPNNVNKPVAKSSGKPPSRPPTDSPPFMRPPPDFGPPGFPEAPLPTFDPPTSRPSRTPRRPAASESERLTQILQELKQSSSARPWSTLSDLERLPVQQNRREEVAAALEPLLQSSDPSTARGALKAAAKWGTATNVATITSLVDSPDISTRWEAIRLLPKLSPTEATAETLATKLNDFSNIGALRDGFKELGPVGETELLKHIDSDDRMVRQVTNTILADIGGAAARDALRELVKTEKDFVQKAMAEHTLRRIESRHP